MKLIINLFLLAILVAIIAVHATPVHEENKEESKGEVNNSSARNWSRSKKTCHKHPRICHIKGSPGRHCCKKKCVNVKIDIFNCGKCGKKCKLPDVCCKGKCVNPWNNRRHCGGCGNKCSKGDSCTYGFCNYA
ncbi:hypothetical protein ACFE04_007824 [Oxalis oulophora]